MAVPIRTCLGCRQEMPQSELVRLVLGSDGRLLPDARRRRGGRGAYVCPDAGCLGRAVRARAFSRSFRRAVDVEDVRVLANAIADMLRHDLAAARRGGPDSEKTRRFASLIEKMDRSLAYTEVRSQGTRSAKDLTGERLTVTHSSHGRRLSTASDPTASGVGDAEG